MVVDAAYSLGEKILRGLVHWNLVLSATVVLVSGTTVVAQQPAVQSAGNEPLTVMTWNLEWFYDENSGDNFSRLAREKSAPDRGKWDWRRDAIADRIAGVRPTVVAVQEIENRRVLYYLTRALSRNHQLSYNEYALEGRDFFTEQDVGYLVRRPADVAALIQRGYVQRLRSTNQFYDVSKHLFAEIEFQDGSDVHRVLILNIHLRAKPEGEAFRRRQARLMQHWVAEVVSAGRDVIVLGDFNSEETADQTLADSDLGIAAGLQTPSPNDDLIDLNLRLPRSSRQTHMLPGRQYDRILCSRSLLEDDPSKPDLVFSKIENLREMCIQGEADDPEQHWNDYWSLAEDQRDLSDHYPVMATFEIR